MLPGLRLKNISLQNLLGSESKGYYKAADADELEVNEMKALRIKGRDILLCRSESGYYALQVKCTHRNGMLTKGVMISGIIQCLNHGCQFEVKTGAVRKGPAKKALKKYQVFENDNAVYIKF